MANRHPLKEVVVKQKNGIPTGICSVCSANNYVIETAIKKASVQNGLVLIEATSNQVNQFGGYTGLTPADFKKNVFLIAEKLNFQKEKLILGGDHLGPNPWRNENSKTAMAKACQLVRAYVSAGFTKIHLDASMHLANDIKDKRLEPQIIAARQAELCAAAEITYSELKLIKKNAVAPVYVIGSEVPVPGGAAEIEGRLEVTKSEDFHRTVTLSQEAFFQNNLQGAWDNVVAVVVQPGVEFGDNSIHEYNRFKSRGLIKALKKYNNLIFEGHSTDYQTSTKLSEMIEDGISILKVGPAVTFAFREALFMLSQIENALFANERSVTLSNFIETLENAMRRNPLHWRKYYHGSDNEKFFSRKFSFSDRCRYYFNERDVISSIKTLIKNLNRDEIPLTLLSQFMPIQYKKVRMKLLETNATELIRDKILTVLNDYDYFPGSS